MKHLMLDIETLGTRSGSVVLWLGAVFFDMETGEFGKKFKQAINIESNLEAGLLANPQTALWWMKQEAALTAWCLADKVSLSTALDMFTEFCTSNSTELDFCIWGNSNRFDMGIMENAFQAVDRNICWKFRNERDVRTLVEFNPKVKEAYIKAAKTNFTLLHDPLVDAKIQILYTSQIYNSLKVQMFDPEVDSVDLSALETPTTNK